MNKDSQPGAHEASQSNARGELSRRRFLCQLACVPALLPHPLALLKGLSNGTRTSRLPEALARQPISPLLDYEEILQLYRTETPSPALLGKLSHLLTRPFVSNRASESGQRPVFPESAKLGSFLRVAQWNIDRGLEFDAIRLAFSEPGEFVEFIGARRPTMDGRDISRIRKQAEILRDADVIVLNEVDWGVNRTSFRNIAAELAADLNMNFAYGVEFVEVDPVTMGLGRGNDSPGSFRNTRHKQVTCSADPTRYLGLHGNAILSRYPLQNVRSVPFSVQGYDWYADEKNASFAHKAESALSFVAFDEHLTRQVRRGGRMMLLADIVDPALPSGKVTVVATHLEDLAPAQIRRRQMGLLLNAIKNIENPVIVAGDMNTSTHNGLPMSFTRVIKERISSAEWWAEHGVSQAIEQATPFGWIYGLSAGVAGFAHQIHDPTTAGIPLICDNPEQKFFSTLEEFRFADGGCFDFRGDARHSLNNRAGRLANSNERARKGFVPTQELQRTYGPIGTYKLNWIFVRPAALTKPCDAEQSYRFSPHFGRTLRELNHSLPGRISDHSPITVDLPLDEPRG
jgi:endonuclease/exonuclease/phosphatase family metal-dependent hydrolase